MKIIGIIKTIIQAALPVGTFASPALDAQGRMITYPYSLRGSIGTSSTTLANGTESGLILGSAKTFNDLVYVFASSSSTITAPLPITFRSARGGGTQLTVNIPTGGGVATLALPVPLEQDEEDSTWTAQLPDVTTTTVDLFVQYLKNTRA